MYSNEKGVPSYTFKEQIPEKEKEKRVNKIYGIQQKNC